MFAFPFDWRTAKSEAVATSGACIFVDMQRKRALDNEQIVSKCGWTPYHGREITGDVVLTMVRGKVVMKDGEVTGDPGWGRFITRKENLKDK